MISHRIKGLYGIHFMLQVVIVAALFWGYAAMVIEFYDFSWFEQYLLYCILLILGLVAHALRTEHHYQLGILHGSLAVCHRSREHQFATPPLSQAETRSPSHIHVSSYSIRT